MTLKMPVTTRSKRKTIDNTDLQARPSKIFIKLVDITNKSSKADGKSEKNEKTQIYSSKSADNILLPPKQTNIGGNNTKPSYSTLKTHASTNSAFTQNTQSQRSLEDALKIMKTAKKVIGKHFNSPSSRLNLDIIPKCLYDMKECQQTHGFKNVARKDLVESRFVLKLYLREERHFQFFEYIRRNLIARKMFPGFELCIRILEEIMEFKSKDPNLTTSFVLSELHNVFVTILNTFPPCHFQGSYLKLLLSPIQLFDGLPDTNEVLPTVLEVLNDLIYDVSDDKKLDKSMDVDFDKNFYLWDQEHIENSTFKSLSRNDKFNRVFMVLDLIVQLLEYDTAMFFTKYSHQFASMVKSREIKPLICNTVWKEYGEQMTVNVIVKKVVSIFVVMNALKYPVEKIKIISRLLSLISNVINMYEHPEGKTAQFSISKELTSNLVIHIQRTIESSNYYSMDLWLDTIENIRSPLIRMKLVNNLYSKITSQTGPISLAVPFKAIYRRDFLNFDLTSKTSNGPKNNERFPRHDNKIRPNKLVLTQEDFIKLMSLYTDAVIRNYHLHEIVKECEAKVEEQVVDSDVEMKPQPSKFNLNHFKKQIQDIDLNEKVTLRTIEADLPNLIHIRMSKDDCIFYRNEIKNFPLIIKLIRRCHEKYGERFEKWMKSLEKLRPKS